MKLVKFASSGRRSGFSLIELLMALFIFATCLLFIFGIFPTVVQSLNQGRNTFLATQFAQKHMELMKNKAWAELESYANGTPVVPASVQTPILTVVDGTKSFMNYIQTATVSEASRDVATGTITAVVIRVKVSYPARSHSTAPAFKSVFMETIVAKPPGV
jgi:prepilin-type N-terminal cleavage/methylation domain-containing protein